MAKVKITPEVAEFVKCITGIEPDADSMVYEHTISMDNLEDDKRQ